MAAGVGIAPTPSALQADVQTLYTIQRFENWSFRVVTLHGLSLIRRVLCF